MNADVEKTQNCRFDGLPMTHLFVDLDFSPPSNSYLKKTDLNRAEVSYPLKLYVSDRTFYVQLAEYKKASEIFADDYAYFSSYSRSWLAHAKAFSEMAIQRFQLNENSFVVEVASNDGYLLKNFVAHNIPCLGIEPSSSVIEAAKEVGVDSWVDFFSDSLAKRLIREKGAADLIIGNNVFAHVPDINDFVKGLKTALADQGVISLEFPHLLKMVEENQFDTIYHEHFSYFSLYTTQQIFKYHGLKIFDVQELNTHGGSLRVFATHAENTHHTVQASVAAILKKEEAAGMFNIAYYTNFAKRVQNVKLGFLEFLLDVQKQGKKIAAYGAAAKGNTLLNYCGVKKDMISFVVDASPYKQGRYLPGSHIPIVNEQELKKYKPDYVIVLPWNLKEEISNQLEYIREWNGKFVVAVPELKVF